MRVPTARNEPQSSQSNEISLITPAKFDVDKELDKA